jgi:tripartite-type tricarboxylate transporter receptor subunit TctC
VQAVAILTRNRARILPSLASAAEQGLADFSAGTWFAVFLPKGTPAPIVEKLQRAVVATMETPSVKARLSEIGGEIVAPGRRSSAYLKEYLEGEIAKWAAAVRAANIKVE